MDEAEFAERISALSDLAKAATPGPWEAYFTAHGDPYVSMAGRGFWETIVSTAPEDYGRANCRYIAAASPELALALIQRIGWLEDHQPLCEMDMADSDDPSPDHPTDRGAVICIPCWNRVVAEKRAAEATYQVVLDDLRDLLDALGLFSGARSQSPHEVMREAIEEARRLRSEVPVMPMPPAFGATLIPVSVPAPTTNPGYQGIQCMKCGVWFFESHVCRMSTSSAPVSGWQP